MVALRRRFVFDSQGGPGGVSGLGGDARLVKLERFSARWTRPCEKESGIYRGGPPGQSFREFCIF